MQNGLSLYINLEGKDIRQYSIQSSAWHLSEIITPFGHSIKFYYSSEIGFQQTTYTQISIASDDIEVSKTYDINQTEKYLVVSSYLERIESNNGFICSFFKSPSNELDWVYKTKPASQDQVPGLLGKFWKYHKLDRLEVKFTDSNVKKLEFEYIENPSERLKLKTVKELSLDGLSTLASHKIEYNVKKYLLIIVVMKITGVFTMEPTIGEIKVFRI